MKKRITKLLRNIVITTIVLLVIILGGGTFYIWYTGQNDTKDEKAIAAPIELKSEAVIKHTQPAANSPESASVQMLSSPVEPGSNVSVTVKTNPHSICAISVIYDKTASTDSGLITKTADDFGTIGWTWTVESTVPFGKWPVKITCTYNGRTAVVIGDLVIAKAIVNN